MDSTFILLQKRSTSLNVMVPEEMKQQIRAYAEKQGVSDSDVVNVALVFFFERNLNEIQENSKPEEA